MPSIQSDCVQKSELLKLQPQLLDSVWFKLLEEGADESTKKVLDDIGCAFAMDQPDTSEPVATGPTSSELQNLSSAQAMQASFGGNIVVSPAKSATSETEVRVESSFQETLERIRRDMQEELSRDLWHHQRTMQLPIAGMLQLGCGVQMVELEHKLFEFPRLY
jgi:hypothetical protein